MRALTIKQPWADCICYFGKRVENRTWPPPAHVVGERIAIHAGKTFDNEGHTTFPVTSDLVGPIGVISHGNWFGLASTSRPRGAVVATVLVAGVTTNGDSPWFAGPHGWILRDVEVLKTPVECRGRQGLWELPPDVLAAVLEGETH